MNYDLKRLPFNKKSVAFKISSLQDECEEMGFEVGKKLSCKIIAHDGYDLIVRIKGFDRDISLVKVRDDAFGVHVLEDKDYPEPDVWLESITEKAKSVEAFLDLDLDYEAWYEKGYGNVW